MSVGRLPPSYEAVTRDGVEAFGWAAAAGWLDSLLREAETLHGWAGRHAVASRPGRGPVHVVAAPAPGPDGRSHWAVRHYFRGGAAAPLLRDRYWRASLHTGRARPGHELLASLHARAHGVSTPAVIAGAVYPAGSWGRAGFYTADLVTELVPRARSLADILLGGAPGGPSALRRAGRLVRSLERAGILHRDMSAANVVLDEAGDAWVVDLDRALLRPGSGQVGAVMLERLERSLHKLDRTHGRSLAPDERRALHSGFEDAA